MSKKEILLNSLLIVFSIMVVLAGLEMSLQLGVVTGPEYNRDSIVCEEGKNVSNFHPTYGWIGIPNRHVLRATDPKEADRYWRSIKNSRGFRDTYNTGDRDILVLGDSLIEGNFADQNSTVPHLLDRWNQNVSFRNYGVAGYGTAQELLVYQNISDQYDHELVILGYYGGNDMKNNIGYPTPFSPARPIFRLRNGSLVQTHEPVNPETTNATYELINETVVRTNESSQTTTPTQNTGTNESNQTTPTQNTAAKEQHDRSVGSPVQQIQTFVSDNTESYLFFLRKTKFTLIRAGVLDQPQGSLDTLPPKAAMDRQTALTRALVDEFVSEAAAHDSDVLIVGFPTRGEVNPDNPQHMSHTDATTYGNIQREMLRNISATHSGVHFLDLKPRLKAEYESGKRMYGVKNGHPSEYGYRTSARAIHDWLVNESYVDPSPGVDFSTEYDRDKNVC